jgi:energy-coupling factor transporter ATP-binding protein EcfA2
MKYSELISFNPIEDVIQLITADDADKAREYVKTYVMSDAMADSLQAPVIDQLQMDEVVDNKGVLVVGNYGTGKSHLMSVISAIAKDADNLQYLQNKKFAKNMEPIAGKFEVLRIEIGGVTMSLREILFGFIQEDFDARGIDYDVPDFDTVKDNKKLIKDMMMAFNDKYPDKGYLIVVDEFLSYLTSRDERAIVLDLEFFRALGEMCSKSNLRVIFGVQEKVFDNPRFSFVSDTLMHVKDRFTQIIITKEATSYVVSERILKKTPEQKALIRAHLEKFCNLYTGMSSKLDEFVDLYPIHPAYIDVFNKIYLIENRHILKNISLTIKGIFNTDVPENAPGIISFDNYWTAIKSNGLLRSDVTISRVVNASQQLEGIINTSFPKPAYKPLAIKIIYALSVHRLTTNGLDVQFGLTAENLKDDLCLYLMMPEQDADFLLGVVKATLRDIMTTVSGQFIICNEANNQYYIDVDKVVDYDEKIKQKASLMADGELNRYFYQVVYSCLEWDKKQYVSGFNIYEHDLNWDSHNIFREGYLFMGLPGERSTAQPERDFYLHIMPPYGNSGASRQDLEDEVYFYFKSSNEFHETISLYAASCSLADISEGKDKDAYLAKANILRKKLVKYLSENKNTCFDVVYNKERKQLIEVLKGRYNRDLTFNDTIDLAASICLDGYFNKIYPDCPVMKTKITRKNMADNARAAFDHFAGRKTQQSTAMLQSFGILDGDKIRPEGSKFASYYIDKVKALPQQGVLNFSDMFEQQGLYWQIDKKFKVWHIFTPIIFLSMVYAGYAVITLKNGETITASSLDKVPKTNVMDLYEFKYLSKPAQISMAELKKLFDVLDINPALLDNPNDREKGVEALLKAAQELCNNSVLLERKLNDGFELWGEPLANQQQIQMMRNACTAVKNEFSNYGARFNTPAKLNNFSLTSEEVDELAKKIALLKLIPEYITFKAECSAVVTYISSIEFIDLGAALKSEIENAKASFRSIRDDIMDGVTGEAAAQKVSAELEKIKDKYIEIYFEEHKKKRLGIEDAKRRGKVQESLALSNLRKLRTIEILSSAKLGEIENDLASLKVCYDLTPNEMKTNPICPHCRYSLEDKAKNVYGQLDNLEDRIDALVAEWTKQLMDTITDPIVLSQKEYLSAQQAKVIDEFIASGSLPQRVDDFFVKSIQALLKNYEPVVIEIEDLVQKLDELPPLDEMTFKAKLNDIISAYTKGKDATTLRIVVKRRESEE